MPFLRLTQTISMTMKKRKGVVFTIQKVLPLIKDGGSIILNSSIAGSMGMDSFSMYSGAKAAIRNFARDGANELKSRRSRRGTGYDPEVRARPVDTLIPARTLHPDASFESALNLLKDHYALLILRSLGELKARRIARKSNCI